MEKKETIRNELDDIFEDMNSYTGEKLREDELFDRVLSFILSLRQKELKEIKKWVVDNHDHHIGADEDLEGCVDKDYPYVNSLELEKFLESLAPPLT